MSQILGWALQILILALGIFLFLRFVRTTRGSTLIRGLVVALFFGVLGIWTLAEALALEELAYLIHAIAGFVVVIFVVLFQPELRRGIAQLGESQRLGRLMGSLRQDTTSRIAEAAESLSERRHGALIAFERGTPLDAWVAEGVRIDAAVSRNLIESIFHPGGVLHDGALVVRRDRLAAAACLFPLSENPDLARALGTRHRAAIGITEETDAVALVVSEETGTISLCRRGVLLPSVAREDLAPELRRALRAGGPRAEGSRTDGSEPGRRSAAQGLAELAAATRREAGWLAASIVLALAILYAAHRDISDTREFQLRLALATSPTGRDPGHGELLLIPPGPNYLFATPRPPEILRVQAMGTRGTLDQLGTSLSGALTLAEPADEPFQLDLEQVRWRSLVPGVGFAWAGNGPPLVALERLGSRRATLTPAHVPVDATSLDPRFEVPADGIVLLQQEVVLVGPESVLAEVDAGTLALALEPVTLASSDLQDRHERLDLAPELRTRGLALQGGPVSVTVPVLPATRDIGIVVREVALVSLAPGMTDRLERWALPAHAQTARLSVSTVGLIPATSDPDAPATRERTALVKRFVEENLVVFVDVAELPPQGGTSLPVRWVWRKDWRKSLAKLGLDTTSLGGREGLSVRLLSDAELLLVERGQVPPEPATAAPGEERP